MKRWIAILCAVVTMLSTVQPILAQEAVPASSEVSSNSTTQQEDILTEEPGTTEELVVSSSSSSEEEKVLPPSEENLSAEVPVTESPESVVEAVRTGWVTENGNRYYLDESGNRLKGWQKLPDGKWYCFDDSTGQQKIGWQYRKVDGVSYAHYFNEDGSAMQEGWTVLYDKHRYFFAEGYMAQGWQKLPDGKWYCFDDSTGQQKIGWQYHKVDGVSYAHYFNDNGSAMQEGWTVLYDKRRYFFAEGYMAQGWQKLPDGKWYCFDDSTGQQKTGWQYRKVDGVSYAHYFNDNGSAMQEGWTVLYDKRRYFFAEGYMAQGWQQLPDGKWYSFDQSNGQQKTGWQYRSADGVSYAHFFYEDGKSTATGWVDLYNKHRYFYADGHMAIGWVDLQDGRRFFDTSGDMVRGWYQEKDDRYYLDPNTGLMYRGGTYTIDGVKYTFDSEGRVTIQQQDGWILKDGERYYILEDGTFAKGWQKLPDGKWYSFDDSTGQQKTGWQYRKTDGVSYAHYFNEDGSAMKEGWTVLYDKRRYFYAEGYMAQGWQKLSDGKWYSFDDSTGEQKIGWQYRKAGGISYAHYFNEDGSAMKEGWTVLYDKRRYFYAEGYMAQGWQKLSDGKWYSFDDSTGEQKIGWQYRKADGVSYAHFFYDDGSTTATGWVDLYEKHRYFYADGHMALGWQTADGKTYYFDSSTGDTLVRKESKDNQHFYYDFKSNNLYKGWQQLPDGKWYNLNTSTGQQLLGWQYRMKDGVEYAHYFYNDGTTPDGWTDVNGKHRYFFVDGHMAQGWQKLPDGKWYCFGVTDGSQQTGWQIRPEGSNSFRYYYFEDGTAATGWHEIGNKLYYFFDDAHAATGWQTFGSKKYYFDPSTCEAYRSGTFKIGNVSYTFDDNGVCISSSSPMDGIAIDVSSHQGQIDWKQVADSGVKYAIIRALSWSKSENKQVLDSYFIYNVKNAKANGIKVGAYIYTYAYNDADIIQEVTTFDEAAKQLAKEGYTFDLPVFVDQEYPPMIEAVPSKAERTRLLRTEMVMLEQKGYYPGMYMGGYWAQAYVDTEQLLKEGYDFWVAEYNPTNRWEGRCVMWQYTSTGSVPGIQGNVDMNYLYKDYTGIINGSDNTGEDTGKEKYSVYDLNTRTVRTDTVDNLIAAIVNNEVGGGLSLTGADRLSLYKAQAVAAHTWLLYQYSHNVATPSVGLKYDGNYTTVKVATDQVLDYYLAYDGKAACTVYTSCNNGKTQASRDYWNQDLPYLKAGVDSPYDKTWSGAVNYQPKVSYARTTAQIREYIGNMGVNASGVAAKDLIQIDARNEAGYITKIRVAGKSVSPEVFYENFPPVTSMDFTFTYDQAKDSWVFSSYGNGHCIGMSQYGAAGYIAAGKDWTWVLQHYYPGCSLRNL